MKDFSLIDKNIIITTNHELIRNWVTSKGGYPAVFDDPEAKGDKLGIRIDFPGKKDERYMNEAVEIRQVSWDIFFNIFEKKKLAFAFDDSNETKDLTLSYKFIPRSGLPTED